ncbi:hypothetical protein, conserved [Trypanosoma brucei gambiense DAL972]|uniref:EF-hand domain-containing protein n=2 Tax=Trypanosoma brucei TaxID=5691 RepID=C9ZPD7_TRYB9|nr:hypothetical protein, conserved [Trypanosoma brucei gambiense DAL972]RHW72407.1 hypothetical protein DPX39_050035100 [Trypanosoma brucei equiperdum]CBH11265.1 hypothetical protein, conserved [Trypanosoma brucei gambiense DAL972]|eukprot:XP_011773552.1 hypothetical protein, conserved [Trypanosoma brucei gambiense DAL972]
MKEFRRRMFGAHLLGNSLRPPSTPVLTAAKMPCAHLSAAVRQKLASEKVPPPPSKCVGALNTSNSAATLVSTTVAYKDPGVIVGNAPGSVDSSRPAVSPPLLVPQSGVPERCDSNDAGNNSGYQRVEEESRVADAVEQLHSLLSSWCSREGGGEGSTVQPPPLEITAENREVSQKQREELLSALVCVLENDPSFGPRLLSGLEDDTLRMLLLFGTAQEYFGFEEVEKQLRKVDTEKEDCVSAEEYNAWVEFALRECADARNEARQSGVKKQQQSRSSEASKASQSTITNDHIAWNLWLRIAYSASVPFMAFGILDNSIFVTAGDAIDRRCAEAFGLTSMTAAALGGVVSGVAGVQMHGVAERFTQRVRLARVPVLTAAQQKSKARGSATRVGNTAGMLVGLLLGMIPLLFVHPSNSRDGVKGETEAECQIHK